MGPVLNRSDRLRMAIVGCSRVMEEGHAENLLHDERFEIRAVVDPAPARMNLIGDLFDLSQDARHSTYETLDPTDLDVAFVATPPHVRTRIVVDLVRSGLDIVSEKPLATTLADADAILDAVQVNGRTLVMAHNYPHLPEIRLIADVVADGEIGALRTLTFRAMGSPGWTGVPDFDPNWRSNPASSGGGRMMDMGIHALNLADVLLGTGCREVSAQIRRTPGHGESRCYAVYRYDGVDVLTAIGAGHGSARIEVEGSLGRVELHYPPLTGSFSVSPISARVVSGASVREIALQPRPQFPPGLYDHIHRSLLSSQDRGDGHDGRRYVEMVHAAYLSAERRAEVALPLERREPVYLGGVPAIWETS